MKNMMKMMVAVAVFAMAVLVTPESTGAGVPEEKIVHNTYSDCETSSGLGDVVFREERILIDEIEFIES
ncbi:hypothetical protein [Rhodoflexus caldus]|uniref:hypothetical protein n=1 Tax=Rhodoflexus caldus TaxID=2891236 RepID=UPI00202A1112|nr:hypothetical protein [Rhodoflexus caldus]